MRSDLVLGAMRNVPNRFLLTRLAAKATRKFHRPNTRVQETVNEVLVRFNRASPFGETQNTSNMQPLRRAEVSLRSAQIFFVLNSVKPAGAGRATALITQPSIACNA